MNIYIYIYIEKLMKSYAPAPERLWNVAIEKNG